MALGEKTGEIEILIPEDSTLSSVLKHLDKSAIRTEATKVDTLDNVIKNYQPELYNSITLKIDVQGYEPEVIKGADIFLDKVKCIFIEISFKEIYEGEKNYLDILLYLRERGFKAVYFCEILNKRRFGEFHQMDAVLIRS
jgi:hypothetical protein